MSKVNNFFSNISDVTLVYVDRILSKNVDLLSMLLDGKSSVSLVIPEKIMDIIPGLIDNMYQDSRNCNNFKELSEIFNSDYYESLFFKYFNDYLLDNKNVLFKENNYNNNISSLVNSISFFVRLKFDYIVSYPSDYSTDLDDSIFNAYLSLNDNYTFKFEFVYFLDLFVSSVLICLLFMMEKMVNTIDKNEFITIMKKMHSQGIEDNIAKLYDLYYRLYDDELHIIPCLNYVINVEDNKFELDCLTFIDYLVNSKTTFVVEFIENINEIEGKVNCLDKLKKTMDDNYTSFQNDIFKLDDMPVQSIRYYMLRIVAILVEDHNMNVLIRGILESARYSVNLYDDYKKNEALKQKERYLNDDFDDEEEIEKDIYDINKIKTGDDFEVFLEMLFKKLGYDVVHCGGSGDQGADLILKKNKKKYVVQAKYYASSLDNTPVQEVCGAIKYYNADKGIVVTNSKFTSGAIKLADANDVKLIDGIKLKGLINKAKKIDEDMLED